MAIDQSSPTSAPDSPPTAAIENEFPAYRAISSSAVLCLVLGLGSVTCYTSLWFLVVVLLSIAIGFVSLRKIKQLPDVLTGAIFARTGIGLALLFGATSVVQVLAQELSISYDAGNFTKSYIEVLKNNPVEDALWYEQPPGYRKTKTAKEIADDLKKVKNPSVADPYGEKTKPIQGIKDRLKGADEHIHYGWVESKAVDGLTSYANTLIKLEGPGSKDFPDKEQYALLQLVKDPTGGPGDWMVKDLTFPYKPASVTVSVEKKHDDGHGH